MNFNAKKHVFMAKIIIISIKIPRDKEIFFLKSNSSFLLIILANFMSFQELFDLKKFPDASTNKTLLTTLSVKNDSIESRKLKVHDIHCKSPKIWLVPPII